MEVFREFTFDAAHRLNGLPEGHKCANLHGHTYRLTVVVEGSLDRRIGWVIDFAEINRHASAAIAELDHRVLNDVPGLEQPTTELIAVWLWHRLKPELQGLTSITLYENARSGVTYRGEPIDWSSSTADQVS